MNIEVTAKTYYRYIFIRHFNYILFPLTIIFFLIAEGSNMVYMRFLAEHDNVTKGTYYLFSGNLNYYWLVLGMLQISYFILMLIRYFMLNMVILLSNEKLHEEMIDGLVRSPSKYFDVNPSGKLINAFSNDLGILDMTLQFSFTDMI